MKRSIIALLLIVLIWGCFDETVKHYSARPAWASYFSQNEWNIFCAKVEKFLNAKGITHDFIEDYLEIELGDSTPILGLNNISQSCSFKDMSEWDLLIDEHFTMVINAMESQNQFLEYAKDFSNVKDSVCIRIWPEEYFGQIGKSNSIYKEDFEGTISAVVFDLETTVMQVSPDYLEDWQIDESELFAIAFNNTKRLYEPIVSQHNIVEDIDDPIFLLESDTFYAASHAYFLDDYQGTYGTIFSIPTRHVLLCYPINDLNVAHVINNFMYITNQFDVEGPGSISSNIYWKNETDVMTLPYELSSSGIEFYPPDEFIEMLNSIE